MPDTLLESEFYYNFPESEFYLLQYKFPKERNIYLDCKNIFNI